MIGEILGAAQALFFTAESGEDEGAFGALRHCGQDPRQFHHDRGAGGVIVGAGVKVTVLAHSVVVHMAAEDDVFVAQHRV